MSPHRQYQQHTHQRAGQISLFILSQACYSLPHSSEALRLSRTKSASILQLLRVLTLVPSYLIQGSMHKEYDAIPRDAGDAMRKFRPGFLAARTSHAQSSQLETSASSLDERSLSMFPPHDGAHGTTIIHAHSQPRVMKPVSPGSESQVDEQDVSPSYDHELQPSVTGPRTHSSQGRAIEHT
ncbi:hypothetical protein F4778DRAFT_775757 [Xylariomycetidae sp. FL2044]|nr:hypothetical protein F4778DRAFT_775757 [Xylariomycetidae sp. FL2044]